MRLASLKELREDIQWLSQEHVREVLISLPFANFCPNHTNLSLSLSSKLDSLVTRYVCLYVDIFLIGHLYLSGIKQGL